MGGLLGKQYRVRIATNWGSTLRREDEAKLTTAVEKVLS